MVKGLRIANRILVGLLDGFGAEDCGGSVWWAVGYGFWIWIDLGMIGVGFWILDLGSTEIVVVWVWIGRDRRSCCDVCCVCGFIGSSDCGSDGDFFKKKKWVCWDMWGFGLV